MQVTSLPVVEPKRGKAAGESPDLQSAGIGWTSLISPDIIVYNQNQQAKTGEPPPSAPSLMLTPPRGAPWHFSGIADGGIAVKKQTYLAASDAGEPTKHIHEHHHYDCTYKSDDSKPPRVIRTGYLVVRDPTPADRAADEAARWAQAYSPQNAFYLQCLLSIREINPAHFHHQYSNFLKCHFYGNPNLVPQNQRFPFPNCPVVGQHQHFHHHFYHSQYQYQSAVNYRNAQQVRFMQHQQPRMQYNQHSHHHYRAHNDNRRWVEQTEYNGRPIVKLY
ncbi:uncharacterized protein [Epargyreus clarus]